MSRGAPDGYQWQSAVGLRGIGGSNHYVVDVAIPANTSSASPLDTDITLVDGWVAQIALLFPPGPATLTHIQVLVNGTQLYPTGASQSFHPDNQLVIIPCDFDVPLVGASRQITLRGWNTDDTWPHTIQAHVWVIPY